jgi:hypothetical protein
VEETEGEEKGGERGGGRGGRKKEEKKRLEFTDTTIRVEWQQV